MDKQQLINFIGGLELPEGEFVLFGGSSLAIRSIRKAGDIDLFVTKDLFDKLFARGWVKTSQQNRQPYLINDKGPLSMQAFHVWEGGSWLPSIDDYINYPEIVEGIPFMPLKELYKWKTVTRRPKDLVDIKLIDKYLLINAC